MVNVPAALDTIIQHVQASQQPNTISVPLYNALHCTVANDIVSSVSLPPYRASIMDGYGLYVGSRTTDIDNDCIVVGNITAGVTDLLDIKLKQNECVYVTTGSVVPDYVNCVIMIENTTVVDEQRKCIHIKQNNVSLNMNIRPVGCDIAQNDTVLHAGHKITSVDIGLLASIGYSHINVVKQPIVGVFSSGNELVDVNNNVDDDSAALQHGQIYDSNRPMLLCAVNEQHAVPYDLGIVRDTEADITAVIQKSMKNNIDILVTSGGVSMGQLDLIKPILQKVGTVHFGRLNMKPGKPCTYATVQQNNRTLHVFALPGNPVSAHVCFQLFVVPAIKLLNGQSAAVNKHNHGSIWLQCKLAQSIQRDAVRQEYHRCIVQYNTQTDEYIAVSTGNQLSSRLMSLHAANGLLLVDPGSNTLPAGTVGNVLLIGPLQQYSQGDIQSATETKANGQSLDHAHAIHTPHSEFSQDKSNAFIIRTAVITMSDSVSQGKGTDKSGPDICKLLNEANNALQSAQYTVTHTEVVPDEYAHIRATLIKLCDEQSDVQLILTTGGTGFSPRDVTPEATQSVLERTASGLVTAMIQHSLQHTPMAALTRLTAGTRNNTVIVNLPGSPKAIAELIPMLAKVLPHAVKLQCQGRDVHTVK